MGLFVGQPLVINPALVRYYASDAVLPEPSALFEGRPVRYAEEGSWVTLGGREHGDKKHVGGFPAKISADGTIEASRVGGLQGKNVKDVKGHFDEQRGGGKAKKPSEGKVETPAEEKRHPSKMTRDEYREHINKQESKQREGQIRGAEQTLQMRKDALDRERKSFSYSPRSEQMYADEVAKAERDLTFKKSLPLPKFTDEELDEMQADEEEPDRHQRTGRVVRYSALFTGRAASLFGRA